MVQEYDCEILYDSGKENVVVDALSRNPATPTVGVSCMRISVESPLMGLTREVHVEGVWEENWKIERIGGEITRFVLEVMVC